MADILRVTSPVINKNIIQPDKASKDPSVPFDMQEIRHITKNPQGSGLLGHHNVLEGEAGAATLMNLLKDPAVTVNYLKNIYMLEEIINLLPVNNNTVTQEIRQLFDALLIAPDHIVDELVDQEYASTLFKGELFDLLRGILEKSPDLRMETAELLKAVNASISRQDVLDSVANSLEYLSEQLTGSRNLSAMFSQLAARVRESLGGQEFEALKPEVQQALKELEQSVLYTPQAARVIPNILYNMSRYQDNDAFLQEALMNLLIHVNDREEKAHIRELVKEYIAGFREPERQMNRSRIMDTLAKIIAKQDRETPMNSLNGEKIEKIITSLLSSPCNYTPLLHFVIPVDYQGMKAFSELWIDPKDEGRNGEPGSRDGNHVHVLITFDVPGVGQMEAEFMMAGKELGFHLYCSESYTGIFEGLVPEFRAIMEEHGYRAAGIEVEPMDHVRSLMEVFKNLPFKRTGVDVKI